MAFLFDRYSYPCLHYLYFREQGYCIILQRRLETMSSLFKIINASEVSNHQEFLDNFSQIQPEVLVIGIIILIVGMVLKLVFIRYERFEMDSMKRGLTNQMTTNQFIWAILLSLILIIRCTCTLLSVNVSSLLNKYFPINYHF